MERVPSPDITKPPSDARGAAPRAARRARRQGAAQASGSEPPDRHLERPRVRRHERQVAARRPATSPRRAAFDVACIAEIVSCFDIVAIQEVRANLRGLRYMLKALGRNWGVLMTDVTEGQGRQQRADGVRVRHVARSAVGPRVRARGAGRRGGRRGGGSVQPAVRTHAVRRQLRARRRRRSSSRRCTSSTGGSHRSRARAAGDRRVAVRLGGAGGGRGGTTSSRSATSTSTGAATSSSTPSRRRG